MLGFHKASVRLFKLQVTFQLLLNTYLRWPISTTARGRSSCAKSEQLRELVAPQGLSSAAGSQQRRKVSAAPQGLSGAARL